MSMPINPAILQQERAWLVRVKEVVTAICAEGEAIVHNSPFANKEEEVALVKNLLQSLDVLNRYYSLNQAMAEKSLSAHEFNDLSRDLQKVKKHVEELLRREPGEAARAWFNEGTGKEVSNILTRTERTVQYLERKVA